MKLKSKLVASGLITAITCALVGSITGTFAWYGYSTRATATVAGTSIGAAANLQIGIRDADANITSIEGLAEDRDTNNIFWQKDSGGLRGDAIADYLNQKGFGSNEMHPISSGNIYEGDSSKRKEISPVEMVTYQSNTNAAADKKDYFVLPLAMRVYNVAEKEDVANDEYLKEIEIYLSDIEVDLELAQNQTTTLNEAFRIDFKEEKAGLAEPNYTLLAPGKDADGSCKLAGLLDLNKDGFADVEEIDYDYKDRHELIYGQFKDGTKVEGARKDDYDVIPNNYEYPVHLDPADHYSEKNVIPVTDFQAYEQQFFGKNSYLCDFTPNNRMVNTNSVDPICVTPDSNDGIVYLTLTAWIEGWDVDDQNQSTLNSDALGIPFHLNLQFQIDRVD